jgi:hypothetical protein
MRAGGEGASETEPKVHAAHRSSSRRSGIGSSGTGIVTIVVAHRRDAYQVFDEMHEPIVNSAKFRGSARNDQNLEK